MGFGHDSTKELGRDFNFASFFRYICCHVYVVLDIAQGTKQAHMLQQSIKTELGPKTILTFGVNNRHGIL